MKICSCLWSPVNTATIDPPTMVMRDMACPVHGTCPVCDGDLEQGECGCIEENYDY